MVFCIRFLHNKYWNLINKGCFHNLCAANPTRIPSNALPSLSPSFSLTVKVTRDWTAILQ